MGENGVFGGEEDRKGVENDFEAERGDVGDDGVA